MQPLGPISSGLVASPRLASVQVVARLASLLCCAAIAAAAWSSSASAAVETLHPYLSSFGSFSNVQGVATDASGDVYVLDAGTKAIDKFDASGNPVDFAATGTNEIAIASAGGASENEIAVDNSTGPTAGDIYLANGSRSAVQIFSPAGSPVGTLSPEEGIPWEGEACGVAVDPAGDVYIGVFSTPGQILKYVPKTNPATNADYSSSIGGVTNPCNIAVDQTGNVFAETWSEGPITRFEPGQFGSTAATGSLVDSKGSSLAVDPTNQELYVDEQGQVAQFGPNGEPFESPVSTFAASGAGAISGSFGIAVGPVNDDIYVSDGKGRLSVFGPIVTGSIPTVTTGSASELTPGAATLNGSVNPEGAPISECFFEYGETSLYGKRAPCAESPLEIGSGNAAVAVHADVTGLVGLTGAEYHFRLVASQTVKAFGEDSTFLALVPPTVGGAYATEVTATSATFHAEVNPRSSNTTYRFEYGTDTGYGSSTPASSAGASATSQPALAHLQGLAANTTYHYRLAATNANGTADGPDATFTTESVGGPLTLLDGRQWEMVSPQVKHGAGILPEGIGGGVVQASASGDALVYVAQNPIETKPEGNDAPELSQILARRNAAGSWSNRTLTTPSEESHILPAGHGTEYKMFTADLSTAILEPYGIAPLAPDATIERAPYLRDEVACVAGSTTCFTPMLTRENTLAGAKWDPEPESLLVHESFVGATPDLKHAIISSKQVKLIEGAAESGLYEWSEGHLEFVSINEAGKAVAGELGSFDGLDTRNAISSDGSRVFWCERECGQDSVGAGPLLMRDIATEETIRIDPPGDVYRNFAGATEDGARVFFTTQASGESTPKLSECAIVQRAGKLSCEAVEVAPELQGDVLGINPDGSVVYFVSTAVLTGGAKAGGNNLYASHLTGGKWEARLIATLADATGHDESPDSTDWGEKNNALNAREGELLEMTARVSPNGRYLAFISERSLTGYDNDDAVSGEPDEEVFLYDGQTGKVICPSCSSSGARPRGQLIENATQQLINPQRIFDGRWFAASIPTWAPFGNLGTTRQRRYLSNEGRLFFNSVDALVPQDSNGMADVYEYEPEGLGSCAQAEGCVDLISSGTSGDESAFVEASESGDDVFFASTARLSTQDVDTDYDVYDAHVCTSAVPCVQAPVSPPPCNNGEACKPAPTPQPPIFGAPASATFTGAGNPAPPATAPAKAKPPTRAQQLAKALKACRRDKSKAKRSSCEKQARKKYGPKPKAKAKSHKANSGKSKAHKGGK
jgi:WD40-like Beta Propeller Repeat